MAIYRGTGGASDSTDDSTISAVTTQAGIATTKASEAASSATDANTSATNAAASATAASGHASTSSDNATASSGSATDAAGFATAASNSATAASNSATAAANSASTANSAEVQAVAAKTTEITGVYNDIANVNTVAGNITNVNTVATNSSNITAVAADASDIGTVAGSISNVNTVGDNIASVNTVASNNTNINTVAADASDIGTVAGISGNVTTVAGISSDVTTVAGLESKMDTVIADASDIGTVAGNIGDVSTVAGISSDVDTVAGISSDVTSVADNMTAVQNATTSATNAATSAASASDSASAAATSAGTASSSASDASTSETNAANSATSASNSSTAASGSASAASGSESASSGSASAAASSESAASTSASNASSSEINAASSATAAAGSATAASGSASAAAASETNATASESNANASKNAAATSATNAATSETNAAASYDSFDDRYLGVKSSAPSTDNDGGALLTGALYFNSTNNTMNVFTGSAWAPVANNNIINPNVALTQDLATNGNDVKFGDNDKATFGASDDLQIYHDGSNSFITDVGTGNLNIRASNILRLQSASEEKYLEATADGSVTLYNNNNAKLATTATGIDVTGNVDLPDNGKLLLGAGDDLQIYHDGNNSLINDTGTGDLRLRTNNKVVIEGSSGEDHAVFNDNGAVQLYFDSGTYPAAKLATTATGIDVTGTATMDGLTVDGSGTIASFKRDAGANGQLDLSFPAQVATLNASSSLAFQTAATERMRLTSTGLGIGTSSPDVKLHLSDSTSGSIIRLERNDTAIVAGDIYGGIEFEGQDASTTASGVRGSITGVGAGGAGNMDLVFNTAKGGTTNNLQRLRISSIGDISFYEDTGTTAKLFWDASAESLGIGTSSPDNLVTIQTGTFANAYVPVSNIRYNANDVLKFGFTGSGGSIRTGTIDTGSYGFAVNTGDGTERMRIDSSGNVGIGTTSPSHEIDLTKALTTIGQNPTIQVKNSWATEGNNTGFDNKAIGLFSAGADTVITKIQSRYDSGANVGQIGTQTNHDFLFTTNNTERMRIDSSGRVGIGTSSPNALVELASNANDRTFLRLHQTAGSGSNFGVTLAKIQMNWIGDDNWASINFEDERTSGTGTHKSGISFTTRSGNNAGTERMRISSTGRVGIGTSSPSQKLHIADSGNAVVLIEAGNTSGSYVNFADTDDTNAGQIQYDHTSNFMAFRVNDNERMRIESSGNLLVGTTSDLTDAYLQGGGVGIALRSNDQLAVSRAGSTVAQFNRNTNDGDIVAFRKDGTTVGSIGTDTGTLSDLYIAGGDTGIGFADAAVDRIIPCGATGAVRDDAIDLGRGGERWRDLYLSGGVYLGGTGAANKLEDYEEGTFTPVFKDSSGNSGSAGTAVGTYVKIGSVVHVQGNLIDIDTSGLTSGDNGLLAGLPFTASGTRAHGLLQSNNVAFTEGTPYLQGNNGQTQAGFKFNRTGTVGAAIGVNGFTSGSADVFFSMSYQTNA